MYSDPFICTFACLIEATHPLVLNQEGYKFFASTRPLGRHGPLILCSGSSESLGQNIVWHYSLNLDLCDKLLHIYSRQERLHWKTKSLVHITSKQKAKWTSSQKTSYTIIKHFHIKGSWRTPKTFPKDHCNILVWKQNCHSECLHIQRNLENDHTHNHPTSIFHRSVKQIRCYRFVSFKIRRIRSMWIL